MSNWRERAEPVGPGAVGGWRTRAVKPEDLPQPEPETGAGQSALEHFANTATLGYLPHLQAAAEQFGNTVMDPTGKLDHELRKQGFDVQENERSYVEARDANLKRLAKESEEHPVASGIGTGLGILSSAAIPVGFAAKGTTLGAKALAGAKSGALMGAIANPGDKENQISAQPEERFLNAAIGGALGAAVPVALEKGSETASRVKEFLRRKAALKATRALGRPTPTEAVKMAQSGEDVALGRELLDSNAIPVLGTPGRIAKRVDALKEKTWAVVDDLLNRGGEDEVVDGAEAGMRLLESRELQELRDAGETAAVKAYEEAAEQLAQSGKVSLQKAQQIKKTIDSRINYHKANPVAGDAQSARFAKRTALRDQMDESVARLGEGKGALKSAFRKHGRLEGASDILEREVGRNQANRAVSLTDTIAGAAELAAGSPVKAIAVGALNKAGRTFGNSIQARVYDAIAKKTGLAVPALANANSQAVAAPAIRAATESLNEFSPDNDPILRDERLMRLFEQDPSLIDAISDEETKAKVKRAIAGGKSQ